MAIRQPIPEIQASAFSAARERCALSVEELAHLACLSKKQIQQIENGGRNAFYSLEIKYVAAKKVAKLIQLDEKEAFDFGPQAELPLASPDEVNATLTQVSEIKSPVALTQPTATTVKPKEAASPIKVKVESPDTSKSLRRSTAKEKPSSKKWFWVLPAAALAVALVQFQPLLQDQLDALMGKQRPAVISAAVTAPPEEVAPVIPPVAEVSAAPAVAITPPPATPPSAAPATTSQAVCSVAGAPMETYKAPSAGKPGNVVFVRVSALQTLCVVDADGVAQTKVMDPGLGHSFYGKPPFKMLSSTELGAAEIFFQGFRIRPSTISAKGMMLVQAD